MPLMAPAARQLAAMAGIDEKRAKDEILKACRRGNTLESYAERYVGQRGRRALDATSADEIVETDRQVLTTTDWTLSDPDWERSLLRRNAQPDLRPAHKRACSAGPIICAEGVHVWGIERLAAHIKDGDRQADMSPPIPDEMAAAIQAQPLKAMPIRKHPGGRRMSHDWPRAAGFVARSFGTMGQLPTASELSDWFAAQGASQPDLSLLDRFLKGARDAQVKFNPTAAVTMKALDWSALGWLVGNWLYEGASESKDLRTNVTNHLQSRFVSIQDNALNGFLQAARPPVIYSRR